MLEDNIKIINDLDIQIKDLEDEIRNIKLENEKIKYSMCEKILILQQIDTLLSSEEE